MKFLIDTTSSLPLIEITDLQSGREILSKINHEVAITNPKGSTKYLGFLVINYIFHTLTQEYPSVMEAILRTDKDMAAKFSAIKLGYLSKSN